MNLKTYFQNAGRKRIAMSLAGNLLVGIGVAIFKFSALGNDPFNFVVQIAAMAVGMLICSLGLSLYQCSQMGTAPYDALALILERKVTKLPYFWCRILCDGGCALICFLTGGIVGLGTLVSAFGFGPVISFFNRTVSEPTLRTS